MNFEVNGQSYFLALMPPNGRLALFAPTASGMARLHIESDGDPVEVFRDNLRDFEDEGNASLN